jgi:cell division protein FtsZ
MGIGSSRGDDRSVAAAEMAISSPLLEASIDGAHGVLLSIQGGSDLGLFEINEAAQLVANSAAPDANIIFGAVIDDALGDEVRVTVIAAGFDEAANGRSRPGRPIAAYQPSQGSDAFGAAWRPVSLPGLKDNAVHAAPPAATPDHGGHETVAQPPAPAVAGSENGYSAADPQPAAAATAESVPAPRPPEVRPPAASQGNGAAEPDRRPESAPEAARAERVGTRRKSVVFEEDDELDVPDFLK